MRIIEKQNVKWNSKWKKMENGDRNRALASVGTPLHLEYSSTPPRIWWGWVGFLNFETSATILRIRAYVLRTDNLVLFFCFFKKAIATSSPPCRPTTIVLQSVSYPPDRYCSIHSRFPIDNRTPIDKGAFQYNHFH